MAAIATLAVALLPFGPDGAGAAGLIPPARICPDQPASGGGLAMTKARKSMICMVNYARKETGLSAYQVQSKLTWSANRKAQDILRCSFSHTACGRPFGYWIRKSGYLGEGGWATGENIAWGSGSLGRSRAIFIAWMKSASHRAAILSDGFSDIGAGIIKGRFEGIPGARIWVLHFGEN
ncbi:MAG TPA: CAP domain-containing protein [Solirubrobacterales bacterium]|nr:CAP domain-containing protein [Solirubrobacterales bacterium]